MKIHKAQPPGRVIALGFLLAIFIGAGLLLLPISVKEGVSLSFIDALYTSTSAVCVTGLISVDAGDTFTPIGQFFLALLIQCGGLGVTSIGAGIILAARKKINIRESNLVREALNVNSNKGVSKFLKSIFLTTLLFEGIGAALSFIVFIQDYPFWQALGISIFHSIAAFNNSGFDILGNYQSLTAYNTDILLNLVTAALIFFGGIGFLVIREIKEYKFKLKKYSMHSKVVLMMSAVLIVVGTLLLKLTENISWLEAFFQSVSARTAGFATVNLGAFSAPGLLIMIVLMFVGASPGSTGGGIKTTTFFTIIQSIKTAATNKEGKAFHYSLPKDTFKKAATIFILALGVVITGTLLMAMFDPHLELTDTLFEVTSAFGTVGLSTGVTRDLSLASKILSILIMYIGRLGPLTVATLWYFSQGDRIRYPEGNISIG